MTIYQCKAGKMFKKEKTLSPDLRRGFISVDTNHDLYGGLIRFSWCEREETQPEDMLFLIPGDCCFKKIQECPSGRVFSLNFISSPSKQYYYWIQETEHTVSDTEILESINQLLAEQPIENEIQMDTTEKSDQPQASETEQKAVVDDIVASLRAARKDLKLLTVISDDDIISLCQIPQFKQRLWATLPASLQESGESIEQIIKSPFFRHSVESFENALCSGEMNSVILSLGLDPSAGTSFGGVRRLLESIKRKCDLQAE